MSMLKISGTTIPGLGQHFVFPLLGIFKCLALVGPFGGPTPILDCWGSWALRFLTCSRRRSSVTAKLSRFRFEKNRPTGCLKLGQKFWVRSAEHKEHEGIIRRQCEFVYFIWLNHVPSGDMWALQDIIGTFQGLTCPPRYGRYCKDLSRHFVSE